MRHMGSRRAPGTGPTDGGRQLAREADVARALREVAGALSAALEQDELFALVIDKLSELLDADRIVLLVSDERARELTSGAASHPSDYSLAFPLGEGLLAAVVRTGNGVSVPHLGGAERPPEWLPSGRPGSDSALVAPLKNNLGRIMGLLLVTDRRSGAPFDDDDIEVLNALSQLTALALDNSRLLHTLIRKNTQLQQAQVQLTRRVRDLELLFELERRTAHAASLEDLARAVLESLARSCDAGAAVLVLSEQEEGFVEFRLLRSVGSSLAASDGFSVNRYAPMESVISSVIETGAPLQLDATLHPLTHPGVTDVASLIAEPLEGGTTPLGALSLMNKRGGPFTAEDLGLLRLVSANVSTAVRLFGASRTREREERLTSIGRLLSQVVHDLKSPLTVISGYVQLMEQSASRKERGHFAHEILKQFDALGAMQREVLAFARGETEVFARKVFVDQFLGELRARLETELRESDVELCIVASPRMVAYFDAERVTRALQNLVRNAAEAMATGGGMVTVAAEESGGALVIKVSDTGPGIPPEIEARLFQSFVTAGKKDGTGLGLAIVKRIVEEHGGTIAVSSVPRGACFVMRLPQPRAAHIEEALGEESAPRSAHHGRLPPERRRDGGSGHAARAERGKQAARPAKSPAASRSGASKPGAGRERPQRGGKTAAPRASAPAGKGGSAKSKPARRKAPAKGGRR